MAGGSPPPPLMLFSLNQECCGGITSINSEWGLHPTDVNTLRVNQEPLLMDDGDTPSEVLLRF